MVNRNLFGEQQVDIPDNPNLQRAANIVLRIVDLDPDVLKGDTIGEIDRKLLTAIWLENGLSDILTNEQIDQFVEWMLDSSRCLNTELVRRARQYLSQHDYIRLPAKAIRDSEKHRAKIGGSLGR